MEKNQSTNISENDSFLSGEEKQKQIRRSLKKAERLLVEIRNITAALKKKIVDLSQIIAAKMEKKAAGPRTPSIKNLLFLKQVGLLEEKRRTVMAAIDYLQEIEMNLRAQMDEAGKRPIDVPLWEEITQNVQKLLGVEGEQRLSLDKSMGNSKGRSDGDKVS